MRFRSLGEQTTPATSSSFQSSTPSRCSVHPLGRYSCQGVTLHCPLQIVNRAERSMAVQRQHQLHIWLSRSEYDSLHASTTPMNSWPIRFPVSLGVMRAVHHSCLHLGSFIPRRRHRLRRTCRGSPFPSNTRRRSARARGSRLTRAGGMGIMRLHESAEDRRQLRRRGADARRVARVDPRTGAWRRPA